MLIVIAVLLLILILANESAREVLAAAIGVLICLVALAASAVFFLWFITHA